MIRKPSPVILAAAMLTLAAAGAKPVPPLPHFNLRSTAEARQWVPLHDVSKLTPTPEGLRIDISGEDPYIAGPAADYPPGMTMWLHVRVKSDEAGSAQVFWFTATMGTSEPHSVHLPVPAKAWTDVKVPMPALGKGYRLRFDPPGTRGSCTLAAIWFTPRILLRAPKWPKAAAPSVGRRPLMLRSGDVTIAQSRTRFDEFVVTVAGRRMAGTHGGPFAGYLADGSVEWTRLATGKAKASLKDHTIVVTATSRDGGGAIWTMTRRFALQKTAGAIDVTTTVRTSARRNVVFLPMLTVMPGLGDPTFRRDEGLFCGLEYLDAPDRSSSEDDIIGPGALRRVPDTEKITFPLMAMQGAGRYVGVIWREAPHVCALFDTPDRVFRSGASVMGLLFPGSNGQNRPDGALLPYEGTLIDPQHPAVARGTIIGGRGASVVPAVQEYVALRGLPKTPDTGMTPRGYAQWAAHAWLDTGIRDGDLFRHAYWPGATNFPPTASADPCVWMLWLASRVTDPALADRLRRQAEATVALVPPNRLNDWNLSHVRYPAGSLIFDSVLANVATAHEEAEAQLGAFEPNGVLPYRQTPGRLDFGRTHFSREANGMVAAAVASVLEKGTLTGDRNLIDQGLRLLRLMARFDNTVPRGAQTWEIPLHTPDILAAAYLVRAYTLGYEITGERRFLDRAIYWAWTGVPFVYMVNPTGKPIGPYATISVLGATNWVAPDWMGMPVQWCGLVYADALHRLVRDDPSGPWKRIADGITACGIQQSFPAGEPDLRGLLPDSFNIRPQTRNGVAINPGTVEANAIRLFGGPELYDFRALRNAGIFVHAPGAIAVHAQGPGAADFTVAGWQDGPYWVLVTGLKSPPRVRIDGANAPLAGPDRFVPDGGLLILRVTGHPSIEVSLPARP